jgi:endonuclease/exonuclease/phosphatase (EEP) superfamily protein YafD
MDLTTHFQWFYATVATLSIMFLAYRQNPRWLIALATLALPWLTDAPILSSANHKTSVTIASANVELTNTNVEPLAKWLRHEKVDIAILLEVSPAYAKGLKTLSNDYPYQHVQPQSNPFGLAIISRYPLGTAKISTDKISIPNLTTTAQLPQGNISVTAFHPMPPLSAAYHDLRNQTLQTLAASLKQLDTPAIIVGDFNATPWSSAFSDLKHLGWRRATPLTPSWPIIGRGVVGIPIDHVLASSHWTLIRHDIGPNLGSDHLPVLVQLSKVD